MGPAGEADAQLITRIARGDRGAVHALYARYARLVHGLALQVLGDGGGAEEVTQDVFLRVWQKADSYDPGRAKVSTWLMRIARNRAIDAARRRDAPARRPDSAWEAIEAAPDPAVRDPARLSLRDQCEEDLRRELALLPAEQRRALGLAFFDGLTHSQVAESLGVPLGTVKTRIRDAMRRLRAAIDEECSP